MGNLRENPFFRAVNVAGAASLISLCAASSHASTDHPSSAASIADGVPHAPTGTTPFLLADALSNDGAGSGADGPGSSGPDASRRTWERLGTGTADAAPAINAALATGSVVLPCGSYRIATPITGLSASGRVLRGVGPGCVTLKVAFADGDVIRVAKGTSFVTIEGIAVESDVARASGAIVDVLSGFHTRISHVMLTVAGAGTPFDGIVADGANTLDVEDVEIRKAARYGYRLTGKATDVHVARSNVFEPAVAVEIDDASGIWLTDMDLIGSSGAGVLVQPTAAGTYVSALYAVGVWTDSGTGNGWEFGGSRDVSEVHLTGCWAATNGTVGNAVRRASDGILIDGAAVDGLSIDNTEVLNNGAYGIEISAGTNISVADTSVRMNSMVAAGRYDGIWVGGRATEVRLENDFSGSGGSTQDLLKATNHQRYGIDVEPSSRSALISLIGNQTAGNLTKGTNLSAGYVPTANVGEVGD